MLPTRVHQSVLSLMDIVDDLSADAQGQIKSSLSSGSVALLREPAEELLTKARLIVPERRRDKEVLEEGIDVLQDFLDGRYLGG